MNQPIPGDDPVRQSPQAQAFAASLRSEGFAEPVLVRREAGGSLDIHTHPFTAKALILEGEIRINVGQTERLYKAGEVFFLAADTPHAEYYGAQGVAYLVGRK